MSYCMWGSGVKKETPNAGIYYGRMYEAKFLVGMVAGAVWNWAPIMIDIVRAVHEKTWYEYPAQDWWYGLSKEGVKLAPFSDLVPERIRKMIEEKKQAIIKGEFKVFPGMSDKELREIYHFESNVVGKLPYLY